ncbi:MAG TPA: Maf family protein [Candidatus Baltobacteraceae bacterium]|nr:Maf family protein [Candidatus Baltobacteraceae bacterium]
MTRVLDRILLASASPRRLELLRSLGLRVVAQTSGYDEPVDAQVSPLTLARRHAQAKALAVAANPREPDLLIVGADTVVDLDGEALGKPRDAADATGMLERLSGRTHVVHTALTLILPGSNEQLDEWSSTRVRFYALERNEIAEYVASGEPMDKAGAYGIQGRAAALVESVDGDFYTVIGFPLARFVRAVRRLGFAIPSAKQSRIT